MLSNAMSVNQNSDNKGGTAPLSAGLCISLTTALVTAAILIDVHFADKPAYVSQQNQIWKAPLSLNRKNISEEQDAVITASHGQSYAGIERLLRAHYKIGKQDLIPNHSLRTSLRKIAVLIPYEPNQKQLDRLNKLISKSFAGNQGKKLADAVIRYLRYHHDIDNISSHQKDTNRHDNDKLKRQSHYFDKSVANRLFAKENALQTYLALRKNIKADETLNPSQKETALAHAKADFKLTSEKLDSSQLDKEI